MRDGLAAVLVLMGLTGCDLSSSDNVAIVTTVQEELQLDLANPLTLDSKFALRFSTIDEECTTSSILADGGVSAQIVHVNISGLLREPDCATDREQLTKDVGLQLDPGRYDLTIAIGDDLVNAGLLSYDGQSYRLALATDDGVQLGVQELRKIPVGVFWGTFSGTHDQRPAYEEFIQQLDQIAVKSILPPGYYGHFEIDEESNAFVMSDNEILNQLELDYVYTLSGSAGELNRLVQDYRATLPENIDFTCTTWSGLTF